MKFFSNYRKKFYREAAKYAKEILHFLVLKNAKELLAFLSDLSALAVPRF
jgi:hypothetical protein